MKKSFLILAVAALGCFNTARAQDVVIVENYFNEFVTFYLSSVDINTGGTAIDFFELELRPAAGVSSVRIQIEFKFQIRSEALGLDFDDKFLTVTTSPFDLTDAVRVRNTDLSTNTTSLHYVSGGSVPVSVPPGGFDAIDFEELEAMQSIIMQSGRLPDGIYRVLLTVRDPGGTALATWAKDIISSNPISLELLSPGGVLADTAVTAINTTYPFFQWESDPCSVCKYKIRVALYKPLEHSSLEDAIDDQTVLPLNQSEGFYDVPFGGSSFQYPTTGAVDLIEGGIYVWQINKVIPTTEGDQEISSFLYAFKITDPNAAASAGGGGGGGAASSPILQALQNSLGDEQFNALFGPGGELENFVSSGVFMLNGQRVQASDINRILAALQQGQGTVISVEVQ